LELKQLEFFVAACDRGSFNKAAECLYTTQPNVSRVISGLEKELGRELFERNSRGIQLTPFGETVREYAENVLKNIGMINRLIQYTRERSSQSPPMPAISFPGFSLSFTRRQKAPA